MLSEIKVPIDLELYEQVCAVCAANGTTPEKVLEDFMTWCVLNQEKAKKYITDLVDQYGQAAGAAAVPDFGKVE